MHIDFNFEQITKTFIISQSPGGNCGGRSRGRRGLYGL